MSKQFYFKQFSLNSKTVKLSKPWFSSIWPIDRTLIRCYHSGREWNWEQWQWKSTPHSHKLQYNWNFTIRLFSVISRTRVMRGEGLTPLQKSSQCIQKPQPTEHTIQLSQKVLIEPIQFSITIDFVYTQLNFKKFSLTKIHFQCEKQFNFKQFSLA